jgi:hypothetical protein
MRTTLGHQTDDAVLPAILNVKKKLQQPPRGRRAFRCDAFDGLSIDLLYSSIAQIGLTVVLISYIV